MAPKGSKVILRKVLPTNEDVDVDMDSQLEETVQASRKSRKTKAKAMDNAVWLDPAAGCPKGPGVTKAATEARKCALSNSDAVNVKKSKKAKADVEAIDEPCFDDNDESDIEMELEVVASAVKPKPAKAKGAQAAITTTKLRTARVETTSKLPKPSVIKPTAVTKGPGKRTGKYSIFYRHCEVQNTVVAVPAPANLDDASSDSEEHGSDDDHENDKTKDIQQSDEGGSESDGSVVMTRAEFLAEQAHVVEVDEDSDKEQEAIAVAATKPKTPGAKPKKASKRQEQHDSEQPQILAPQLTQPTQSRVWSEAATPVKAPGGEYTMTVQPPVLRAVIKNTFSVILEYAIFTNMYPNYRSTAVFTRNIFMKAASVTGKQIGGDDSKKAHAKEIFERAQTDLAFIKCFSDLFRSASKTVAHATTPALLGLTTLSESELRKRANDELKGERFIYARKKGGAVLKSAPYLHPCVIVHVRDWAFKSQANSAAVAPKYIPKFCTSLPDDEDAPEKELPIDLIAASATAVQSVLLDIANTGSTVLKTRFDGDALAAYYRGHVKQLEEIRRNHATEFHRVMLELYNFATYTGTQVKKAAGNFDFNDRDSDDDECISDEGFGDIEQGMLEMNGTGVEGVDSQEKVAGEDDTSKTGVI
ncbi:hypothetical protein VNI00_019397 [Paramarasmius palmivorus]|uniref:DUF6532 domain-containing protein n=1 Tax=Paramarasmius palmivorus TaxID=297713 RepID=A0AAW0APU4_9AGAR